jgi:hypothetical protein
MSAEQRLAVRQQQSKPIMEKFEKWLSVQKPNVLPKSPIGEAFDNTLSNWVALNRYLEDSDLAIDNNKAEPALRGIAQ